MPHKVEVEEGPVAVVVRQHWCPDTYSCHWPKLALALALALALQLALALALALPLALPLAPHLLQNNQIKSSNTNSDGEGGSVPAWQLLAASTARVLDTEARCTHGDGARRYVSV